MFVTIMYSKESNRQLYIDIIVFFLVIWQNKNI